MASEGKVFNRPVRIYVANEDALYVNDVPIIDDEGNLLADISGADIGEGTIPGTALENLAVGTAQIAAAAVNGAKLSTGKGYFSVAVETNGETAVNVFGAGGAPVALTVTSVLSVAQDGTAGNITLSQASNTVCTIAKGTNAGVPVGGVSLAHTTYAAGDACAVLSSSVGNSIVIITFQVA